MRVTNVEMVEMTDNYFGFPLELPVVLVSYQRSSGSCREPLPYSQVNKVEMMRNMAVKADWTLVELEHSYSEDLGQEKVTVDKTFLLLPCQCEDIRVNSNITNVCLRHLSLSLTVDLYCRRDCTGCRCRHRSVTTRVGWWPGLGCVAVRDCPASSDPRTAWRRRLAWAEE